MIELTIVMPMILYCTGQLALSAAALVLRSLAAQGRIVIAGDSEQLAPILTAEYPEIKPRRLFGSILDCLMHLSSMPNSNKFAESSQSSVSTDFSEISSTQSTVVQLTENFRYVHEPISTLIPHFTAYTL